MDWFNCKRSAEWMLNRSLTLSCLEIAIPHAPPFWTPFAWIFCFNSIFSLILYFMVFHFSNCSRPTLLIQSKIQVQPTTGGQQQQHCDSSTRTNHHHLHRLESVVSQSTKEKFIPPIEHRSSHKFHLLLLVFCPSGKSATEWEKKNLNREKKSTFHFSPWTVPLSGEAVFNLAGNCLPVSSQRSAAHLPHTYPLIHSIHSSSFVRPALVVVVVISGMIMKRIYRCRFTAGGAT